MGQFEIRLEMSHRAGTGCLVIVEKLGTGLADVHQSHHLAEIESLVVAVKGLEQEAKDIHPRWRSAFITLLKARSNAKGMTLDATYFVAPAIARHQIGTVECDRLTDAVAILDRVLLMIG